MAPKSSSTFSPDEIEFIGVVLQGIWQYIGGDCLQGTADEKGQSVERVTMSRRDVIEICLDAGRPEEEFRRSKNPLVTPDFLARWNAADYELMKKIARKSFTYTRYGM